MKDVIYRLLNQTVNDSPDTEPLTNEEVNEIMAKFRNEIHTDAPVKKRRIKGSVVALIAAAAMITCCGTAVVAAEHLGVFDRLTHKKDMTFTLDEDSEPLPIEKYAAQYDYGKIADAAVSVPESVTAEAAGLDIQVDSVYCDGTTLMIGITGSMKDGNPEHKQLINLDWLKIDIGENTYDQITHSYESNHAGLQGSMVLDEGAENQFSGEITLIVFGDAEITESTTAEISINKITAQENYMDENSIDLGTLTFSVGVTPDASLCNQEAYTVTEDGYSVRFYEISPAMMIVGFSSPELSSWLNDENGNQIEMIGVTQLPDYGDGYSIGCMVPVTSGYVTAVFYDKSGEQDENGNFINKKEIQINMDEVYAALKGDA